MSPDNEEDASESDFQEEVRPYKYQRLSSNQSVRLLKLQGAGKKDQEIICELVEKRLSGEEKIEFEALSWSWSRNSWNEKIKIKQGDDVFVFLVPPSLVNALKALRWKRKVRTLWVDAICIDQSRPEEKNHQVPMMSLIYGIAKKVCIWIGDGDSESKVAIDFIKQEVLRLQGFDELCESQEATAKWRAMLNLMKREWFERRACF